MPIAVPHFGPAGERVPASDIRIENADKLEIRPARVDDVHSMSALINSYAANNVMLARGPQYLYQHIQDYLVVVAPTDKNRGETVIACGALHVLWADLAEIRSIAVHKSCQRQGLGRKVVDRLIERCRDLRIPRVFVFTLVAEFFNRCGFNEFDRNDLPPVVWVECSKCPKFYRCDEIGMIRDL